MSLNKVMEGPAVFGAVPFWPGSGSSSSPVVHNLLLKKRLYFSIYSILFNERYQCFALLFQYFI